MAPRQHLAWLEANVRWFDALPADALDVEVPACPGWTIEYVLNHLAIGLGLAYPYGLRTPPGHVDLFGSVPWPERWPEGRAAQQGFTTEMGRCLETFRSVDPETPCQTYFGPGVAGFWFRRAAIETTLHRMDVAAALAQAGPALTIEQTDDAITEAVELVLPFAAELVGAPPGSLGIAAHGHTDSWQLGGGRPEATVEGGGHAVLGALWGRPDPDLSFSGDTATAESWLGLVEVAFAGR